VAVIPAQADELFKKRKHMHRPHWLLIVLRGFAGGSGEISPTCDSRVCRERRRAAGCLVKRDERLAFKLNSLPLEIRLLPQSCSFGTYRRHERVPA